MAAHSALVFIPIASGILALVPFFWQVHRGRLPNSSSFAAVGIFLFFNVGWGLELASRPPESPFLRPSFEASLEVFQSAILIVAAAPWLVYAGYYLIHELVPPSAREFQLGNLRVARRAILWGIFGLAPLVLSALSVRTLLSGQTIWVARSQLGQQFGILAMIFYLPLFLLAFFVRQQDSRSRAGQAWVYWLTATSAISSLAIGQRTLVLLPLVILSIFYWRISVPKMVVYSVTAVVVASLLLTVFKWQYAGQELSREQLIVEGINNDFARAPTLVWTLAEVQHAEILPFPMSGYVYALLLFVPRELAPFKDYSTATHVTATVAGSSPHETAWNLGVGFIEEAILNAGLLWLLFALVFLGVAMAFVDRLGARFASLVVPARLASIWLFGYNLPSILQLFGLMALAAWGLESVFGIRARQHRTRRSTPIHSGPQSALLFR